MKNHTLKGYALVILKKDNNVLSLQRSPNASFAPGHYSLVGGKVEKNETFRDALIRETQEELGIVMRSEDLHFKHVFYRDGVEHELVACVFECDNWQGEIINKEPEKHTEMKWTTIDNLPVPFVKAHKNVLHLVHNKTTYSEQ